jgi:NAD(P)-dependent dehydrogenase (short-subunit alcohol dehydrogenase family)
MPGNERFDLTGRVALVTAGCAGLGADIAKSLASLGARVVATSRDEGRARLFEEECNGRIRAWRLTFEPDSVRDSLAAISDEFGRIDILVNAAASRVPARSVELMAPEDLLADYRDSCISAFLCMQTVMAAHDKTKTRSIINIGSIYASLAVDHRIYDDPLRQTPVSYACSKGAVVQMTKYLAAYWAARGVRVNCVSPGGIRGRQTPEFMDRYCKRVPMRRMAELSEVSAAVAFLASDASSYITGVDLVVDGGLHVW